MLMKSLPGAWCFHLLCIQSLRVVACQEQSFCLFLPQGQEGQFLWSAPPPVWIADSRWF